MNEPAPTSSTPPPLGTSPAALPVTVATSLAEQDARRKASLHTQFTSMAALALVLSPVAAICLVLAFTGRARHIPFIMAWAIGALVLSLAATARGVSAYASDADSRASLLPAIGASFLLLLVPAAVVLYLILSLPQVSPALAVTQVILFLISAWVCTLGGTAFRRA